MAIFCIGLVGFFMAVVCGLFYYAWEFPQHILYPPAVNDFPAEEPYAS